jgi:hypothetical protein
LDELERNRRVGIGAPLQTKVRRLMSLKSPCHFDDAVGLAAAAANDG